MCRKCSKNDAVFLDRWHIYWHTLEEWADMVYSWVHSCGMVNTVCTLYEITEGENTADEGLFSVTCSTHEFFFYNRNVTLC